MTNQTWNGFSAQDKVLMLVETRGETADGEEVIYSAETPAVIVAVRECGAQGSGVDVVIGEDHRTIVNTFDDSDLKEMGGLPFRLAEA